MSEKMDIQEQFFAWLSENLSKEQLSEFYIIYPDVESFCLSNGILSHKLFETTDLNIIKQVLATVEKNKDFRKGRRNIYRIDTAIWLYQRFIREHPELQKPEKPLISVENDTTADFNCQSCTGKQIAFQNNETENISDEEMTRYAAILENNFSEDGYQLGRAIFRGRFRNYYASLYGNEPEQTDEQIDSILCHIGTQRDGRVFPKQDGEHSELLDSIISEVMSAFDRGATAIYPAAVFERYHQQLADELHIYTESTLCELILERSRGKLYQSYSHIALRGRESNPAQDIRMILRGSHSPLTVDEIHKTAWFIPLDKTKWLLAADKSLICIATGTYFSAPNFPISESEKSLLISMINEELDYRGHITDVELMSMINDRCPSLAINVGEFSRQGVRDCLGYLLGEHFSFNGPIITRRGCEINRNEVFGQFAKERERMTYDELKSFADEMETQIYWDAVISEMVRLNAEEFIRKDMVEFDTTAIDDVLDGMCDGEYVPLKEINLFLSFPNIGYQWNSFVLESFLFNFSRSFRLVHTCFGKKDTCGAMVRAESAINDYDALITDVLARAGREFTEGSALNYLVEQGYQAKRSYKGIGNVLRTVKLTSSQQLN